MTNGTSSHNSGPAVAARGPFQEGVPSGGSDAQAVGDEVGGGMLREMIMRVAVELRSGHKPDCERGHEGEDGEDNEKQNREEGEDNKDQSMCHLRTTSSAARVAED
ncbi:hypothetical protein CVT25_008900 [Psilocybe cyanescens]|uniref:Uncharacterized protein n=1 Tax=Psilocybe cyanescens TaxID=93625 RepID=A0A409XNK6_PSICY|nr:hypothetical protein CVT25_008900 [Psilocybe cyanescens]